MSSPSAPSLGANSADVAGSIDAKPPIVRSLESLYGEADAPQAAQRYAAVCEAFHATYGMPPDFIARAPGRVNLIGEHIDYNGFGVLPMALARDTLIAARVCRPPPQVRTHHSGDAASAELARQEEAALQANRVEVANTSAQAYPEFVFSALEEPDEANARIPSLQSVFDIRPANAYAAPATGSSSFPHEEFDDSTDAAGTTSLPTSPTAVTAAAAAAASASAPSHPSWVRYVQCGLKGVWESEKAKLAASDSNSADSKSSARVFPGLQLLVDGTVPPAAGLSSSSSLVCCASLVAAYALQLANLPASAPRDDAHFLTSYNKFALSALAAQAERFVGTAGGGMDQAASFLAAQGLALKVEFEPELAASGVRLPPNAVFLVAHSNVRAEKARSAATQFNLRVLECTLAAHVLAKVLKVAMYQPEHTPSPSGDVAKLTLHDVMDASGMTLKEMIAFLQPPSSSTGSNAAPAAVPPLHAAAYTLPELHSLLGVGSLKPLLAFRPTLIDALGEDAYFARSRTGSAAGSGAAGAPRTKVRVAFGRNIVSNLDRATAARAAAAAASGDGGSASASVAQNRPRQSSGEHVLKDGDQIDDDGMDEEEEEEDEADRFEGDEQPLPLSKDQLAREVPFPWELRAKEERAVAAKEAAAAANTQGQAEKGSSVSSAQAVADAAEAAAEMVRRSLPYRKQGDPNASSAESVAQRALLQRHPLVVKSINKFWTLLSKDSHTGELGHDAYSMFFLRVCKLLNPDLGFEDAFALVQKDWEHDVMRTKEMKRKERAEALAAASEATADAQTRTGSAGAVARSAARRQAAQLAAKDSGEIHSIPHAAFAASLFELVDVWSIDSTAAAYSDLLEQLYCKLTVKVLSSANANQPVRPSPSAAASEQGPAIPTFALLRRALHVYSEAQRVEEFAALCASAQQLNAGLDRSAGGRRGHTRSPSTAALASTRASQVLDSLGSLMNASHVSCARQYECSCDELDQLVNVCVQHAGAVGARLTGAGWGGCVVALFDGGSFVPPGTAPHSPAAAAARTASIRRICDIVVEEFYRRRCRMSEEEIESKRADLLFVTEPAAGAAIYLPTQ
jgi:galactokinase